MPRLTREQSRAATREKLLAAARANFARHGYDAASVDRIADEAGFSKGAVYSNFRSKEDLFLAVMASPTLVDLPALLTAMDTAPGPAEIIDTLSQWADEQARDNGWALLILDHVRSARQSKTFGDQQAEVFKLTWTELGKALAARLPEHRRATDPETLGALMCELAYAPAMSFTSRPTAGDLVRLALSGLFSEAPAPAIR
ncbi:TetR/AcrR family transcriptional regulator [Sphingomonas sp. PR090111-T3T-6A]|uniref:TetR/AcrR family transcriptional regulator n=1 Tax=Sphingomonas sp. PR090111-T3T-6A TaxID=685778 RepID=UPI0003720048|nr:TetR/AcrR family transcriptional regulator [Sphingomonas sp. PR090111-T3T-6A]